MIALKKEFYFIFIFHCALSLTSSVWAEGKADSLFRAGEFYEAAIEYERTIYHSRDYKKINQARYAKALCYKNLHEYPRAYQELQRINFAGLHDSIHFKYRYQSALLAYLSGEFSTAESIFQQLEAFTKDTTLLENTWLVRTLNYNELYEYEKARLSGVRFIELHEENGMQTALGKWDSIYGEENLPRLKKQKIANVLQMVPGLGQIYAGAWGEGIFNFMLNATFLGFGVYQVFEGYYLTGYFSAVIPLNKFYFGGHKRTSFLVEKTNYERIRAFNSEAKEFLLKLGE
ncbi:MAG: hypothetical protein ACOC3T_02045 [Bacteroidota bacterium]